jgi:alpha-glucosidase
MNYVGQQAADPLTFVLYPSEGSGSATFYEDAGDGYEHVDGHYARRTIKCEVEAGNIRVEVGEREGQYVPARRHVRLELREIASKPKEVRAAKWHYDPEQRRLTVDLHEKASSQSIHVSME